MLEFKHELIRNIAYDSLLRAERRDIHRRIAFSLECDFPEESARHPEVVAYHCAEAGLTDRAIELLEIAGRRAIQNSSNLEAVAHLSRAINLLHALPESWIRKATELRLQLKLAAPLMVGKGYGSPDVARTVERALALSQEIGHVPEVFPLLYGRWSYQQVTGQISQSLELAQQLVGLAEGHQQIGPRIIAYRLLGTSLQVIGHPKAGLEVLVRALALFQANRHTRLAYQYGSDIKVTALCSLAAAQWMLGLHRSAERALSEAWKRAQALSHINTLAYCGSYRLAIRAVSGATRDYDQLLEAQVELATRYKLPVWLAVSKSNLGWIQLQRGDAASAAKSLRECLDAGERLQFIVTQVPEEEGGVDFLAARALIASQRDSLLAPVALSLAKAPHPSGAAWIRG
jgi:tetratricopeptide (TPR) repeat protein